MDYGIEIRYGRSGGQRQRIGIARALYRNPAPEGETAKCLARKAELESYLAQQFGDAVYLDSSEGLRR